MNIVNVLFQEQNELYKVAMNPTNLIKHKEERGLIAIKMCLQKTENSLSIFFLSLSRIFQRNL